MSDYPREMNEREKECKIFLIGSTEILTSLSFNIDQCPIELTSLLIMSIVFSSFFAAVLILDLDIYIYI